MAEWFRLARAADPSAKLYINDYGILSNGGNDLPHRNGYISIIEYLDSLGAPVDGIGLQSHFRGNFTAPERVLEILDRFAEFNKEILITEFDVEISDEQIQADYTRDFLTAVFSHPAVRGFYMWGFWEGRHWRPLAAMYRLDWTPKPNALVWDDLVFDQWWTDAEGAAGADGVFRARGFLGEYDVEVTRNGAPETFSLTTAPDRQPNYVVVGAAQPGAFTAEAVVNAASFAPGPVAPGEIVTIFGTGFGSSELAQAVYDDGQLQTWAGDTKVCFDGVQSPMVYSLQGQISAIVPYSVSDSTSIEIEYLGTKTAPVNVPVASAAPGIFTYSGGAGQAVAINYQNGGTSFNSAEQPVEKGAIVTLYITGDGPVSPPIADGVLPQGPDYPAPVQPLSAWIGGVECTVEFKGLVYAGVTQLNVRVPENAPSGDAMPLEVLLGGQLRRRESHWQCGSNGAGMLSHDRCRTPLATGRPYHLR